MVCVCVCVCSMVILVNVDRTGKVSWVSNAAKRMLHTEPSRMTGKPYNETVLQEDKVVYHCRLCVLPGRLAASR